MAVVVFPSCTLVPRLRTEYQRGDFGPPPLWEHAVDPSGNSVFTTLSSDTKVFVSGLKTLLERYSPVEDPLASFHIIKGNAVVMYGKGSLNETATVARFRHGTWEMSDMSKIRYEGTLQLDQSSADLLVYAIDEKYTFSNENKGLSYWVWTNTNDPKRAALPDRLATLTSSGAGTWLGYNNGQLLFGTIAANGELVPDSLVLPKHGSWGPDVINEAVWLDRDSVLVHGNTVVTRTGDEITLPMSLATQPHHPSPQPCQHMRRVVLMKRSNGTKCLLVWKPNAEYETFAVDSMTWGVSPGGRIISTWQSASFLSANLGHPGYQRLISLEGESDKPLLVSNWEMYTWAVEWDN